MWIAKYPFLEPALGFTRWRNNKKMIGDRRILKEKSRLFNVSGKNPQILIAHWKATSFVDCQIPVFGTRPWVYMRTKQQENGRRLEGIKNITRVSEMNEGY